jgi:hypothetical protein
MPDPRQFTNYLPVIPPKGVVNNFLTPSADYEGHGRPIKTDVVSRHHVAAAEKAVKLNATKPRRKEAAPSIFHVKKR